MLPVITALLPTVGRLLEQVLPDPKAAHQAKQKLAKLAQDGALAELEADVKLALAQTEINKIESASGSLWKGGWRPLVGWACGMTFVYNYLARPLLPWTVNVFGLDVPPLPPIETTEILPVLFGLLGLGAYRSFERIRHVIPPGK